MSSRRITPSLPSPAPWTTVEEGALESWVVLRMQRVRRRHAGDGREAVMIVAHAPTWVNIVAVTERGTILLVEQFRHGTAASTIEIPGGVCDADEDPRLAAERECEEETGWRGEGPATLLGVIEPNPAFQTNRCHAYLWTGCRPVGPQKLDANEDIVVHEWSWADVLDGVRNGTIRHALVLSALSYLTISQFDPLAASGS